MKNNRIITIIAAAALAITVSAQQSVHDNYIGVNFGGGLNSMLYKPANGTQGLGFGFDAGIHYGHFFNKTVGLGVGLQYSWANAYATYNWNEVTNGLTHPDNPNTPYNLTTGFTDFKERQNVGYISIPVEILFRKPLNDRAAFIGGIGLALDLPIHGKYLEKGGSYSTTGVFPAAGSYVFENMPEHGFSTYTTTQNAKINNRAKVGGSVIADLGFRVALNENWGMYFGVYAGYGFTNLLAEAKADEMIMINATDPSVIDYRGTFDSNETGKANLLRCGVKIAVDLGWSKARKETPAEEPLPVVDEEAERLAREAAEKAAREKAEAERLAAEKAAREKAEAERIAREKAEAERLAAEKAFRESVESVSVHFDIAGAELNMPEAEQNIVDQLCERMKADRSMKIVITGHTDNSGDPEQNLRYFGMRRAKALKNYMVNKGVSADQIRCDSKGQTEPVAPNDTRANRAKNRRADIRFE
ncbi:MAG: OmpA family protein [Paludibacteraceae bacterium]|nr:OmpA family protein [Paludibacteraceae bacterium]